MIEALAIARGLDDQRAEATILRNFGIAYTKAARFNQAIESFEKVLQFDQRVGDRLEENSLLNLGIIYRNLGDFRQAIKLFERALSIAQEIGDRQGEAIAFGNLGSANGAIGSFDEQSNISKNLWGFITK